MIGMELLGELIQTVVLTGRLKDHAPVSLLIIAPPEQGKTTNVIQFAQQSDAIAPYSDITGIGLQKILQQNEKATHIAILDMLAASSHKQSVNKYLVAMMNACSEEGIISTATPEGLKDFKFGKRGFIACLTPSMVRDGRGLWNKVGFTSRMWPFNYKHSTELQRRVKDSINHPCPIVTVKPFRIPVDKLQVKLPVRYIREIEDLANLASSQASSPRQAETGYRRLKQARAIVCAHSLLRPNWKNASIIDKDLQFLRRVLPYFSYARAEEI
jgi:hypothetical protein